MRYRQANVGGRVYFFTVNLAERKRRLLVDYVAVLRKVIQKVKAMHPFYIDAMVILPNHLHTVWTLPEGDVDYPTRWALIKAEFSRHLPKDEQHSQSRAAKGERGIWQRRYWEHLICDEGDYARHVDYCHFNPVKHGYVKQISHWPYSTFHRDMRRGLYLPDWAGGYNNDFDEIVGWGDAGTPTQPPSKHPSVTIAIGWGPCLTPTYELI